MIQFLNINEARLFDEVVSRGRHEGVADFEAYKDLVETVIEEHRQVGEIHDDNPTEAMEDWMEGRWQQYQDRISESGQSTEA